LSFFWSHHAEGLVDPNRLKKKPSLTWYAPEHVDSGKRKMKIAHVYQLFKKRDFYFIHVAKIGKNGIFRFFLKILIFECSRSKTVWCVPRPEKRENSLKKFENRSILAF
jgi:hypothetical protein